MDLKEEKAAARTAAERRRDRAHAAAGAQAPERVAAGFDAAFDLAPGRVVSFYWPIRSELDPRPLARRLLAAGHDLCLPVVEARGAPLRFRRWRPETELTRGNFGVPVPGDGAAEVEPEVLLVPLLAYDPAGYRLGYGGGFYDRTLRRLRARGARLAVGIAFSAQRVARVPRGPGDERLDAVVTEAGVERFGDG